MSDIEPFYVHVADSDSADLRARRARVRLPEPETVPDATQDLEIERALREPRDRYRYREMMRTRSSDQGGIGYGT